MFILRKLKGSILNNSLMKNQIEIKCGYLTTLLKGKPSENTNEDVIKVNIGGEIHKFPFVWLRDNCQCEECFHTTAKSRIIDWNTFNIEVKPLDVRDNNENIKVSWDDGHTSQYSYNWLKFRSFNPQNIEHYKNTYFRPPKITWNKDNFEQVFTKHNYNDVINTNKGLHNWLHNLAVYGVALIENTPNKEDAVDDIVSKIGFTRRTHYGVKFIVQHVPGTVNVAYLSSTLPMHTDLPYYNYCPGVNILHCLVQTASEGGENQLIDCHFVANYMKEHHPKEYHLLTTLEVEWSDIGVEHDNEFYKLHRCPVISLDRHGEIERISFSIAQRGSRFLGDFTDVKDWYKAHGLFFKLSQKFAAKFKTNEGNILVFDNVRLLHGRAGYDDAENNVRKVIGAYVDWDEIYSRLRCVKVKLQGEVPTN